MAAAVVVGDAEDLALTNLAWDLGASYVVRPPQSRQLLAGDRRHSNARSHRQMPKQSVVSSP